MHPLYMPVPYMLYYECSSWLLPSIMQLQTGYLSMHKHAENPTHWQHYLFSL